MNISTLFVNVYDSKTPRKLDIYATDTKEIIQQKIIHTVEPKLPSFVFFPKNFNMQSFLEKTETFTFLNLFTVTSIFKLKPYEKSIEINFSLLDELLLSYNIQKDEMYKLLLFRLYLSKSFIADTIKLTIKKKKSKLPSLAKPILKKSTASKLPTVSSSPTVPSQTPIPPKPSLPSVPPKGGLIPPKATTSKEGPPTEKPKVKAPKEIYIVLDSDSEAIVNFLAFYSKTPEYALIGISNDLVIRETIQNLNKKWNIKIEFDFKKIIQRNNFLLGKIELDLNLSKTYHEKFINITPLESTPIEETGKVVFLEIETQETSTGIIFDHLILNEKIPVARYKDFYKIYDNVQILEDVSTDTVEKNELYVYRYEKRRGKKSMELVSFPQIFVQNTSYGLVIQVLLLNDTNIPTEESLFKFLNLPNNIVIRKQYNRGLLGNFTLRNPKPFNYPSNYPYASLQSPIFNNLLMNDTLFEHFLYVNDSDKIGKENNSSAVYFHTSSVSSEEEKREGIKVGNWKKESTRFGDLSAVLTPTSNGDEHQIQCKILRSFNQDAVEYFQYILSRLLVLYNEALPKQIALFQTFLPLYRPYEISKPVASGKDLLLTKVEPLIFKPNDYTRGCQNKPPVIVEDISNLQPEKVLQFPKYNVEFKGQDLKPRYYYCEDGIPGYIQMNVQDHPFDGKAPCCYAMSNFTQKKIDARLKKNELVEKSLFPSLYETEEEIPEARDKPVKIKRFVMYTPTNEYKVLNRLGQFGNLPSSIVQFLDNIHLEDTYYRVGMSSEWKFSSILGCGIYASILDEINKDEKKAETYKFMPIETQARRKFSSICFDIVAQENSAEREPVKDYILNFQNKLNVRRLYNAIQYFFKVNLLVINTKGEWVKPYSSFSFCSHFFVQRPILLLYEHTHDLRYEIIAKSENDKIIPYFKVNDIWKFIYQQVLSSYTKNAISCSKTNSWIFTKDEIEIDAQILNKFGQVQILFLKCFSSITIPIFLKNVMAPFTVSTINKIKQVPTEAQVQRFIQLIQAENVIKMTEKGVFSIDNSFFIPYETKETIPEPHFIYYFLEENKIISKWNEQVGNFMYTNLLKDYLLILLGQFIKTCEIKEPIPMISFFLETHIKWISSYENDWKQFQPLFEQNSNLYNGEFIFVPEELEYSIKYLLEWYYRNQYEKLLDLSEQRELPTFYLYNNQFRSIVNHVVQKCPTHYESHVYNNLFLFSLQDLMDPTLLEEETVYFHYDMKRIRQFFIVPFSPENKKTTLSYIGSILTEYYQTNHMSFKTQVVSSDKIFNNVLLKEKEGYYFVFYSFV